MRKAVFDEEQPEVRVCTFDGKAYVYIALNPIITSEERDGDVVVNYEYDYNEFVTDVETAEFVKQNPERYLDYVSLDNMNQAQLIKYLAATVSRLSRENASLLSATTGI